MSSTLLVRNHQSTCIIYLPLLRQIARELMRRLDQADYELDVHLVSPNQMVILNQKFLRHRGSTDVITFDYRDQSEPKLFFGEIFICVAEALSQARRFRTSWQTEVVRYLVHGVLHLCGYDDRRDNARRRMKRAENRLLQALAARFALLRIGQVRAPVKGSR